MIDVAKAMDEERGSTPVTQRIPSPNPINPDPDNTDSDSSLKQSPRSDEGDSSTGSISSSPESKKPGSGAEDKGLPIVPFIKVSLVSPQLSIVSSPQPNPDETGKKPVLPTVPLHSGSDVSDDEFNPLEVGSLEQRTENRQKLIAGLPPFEGPIGRSQTPSTVSPCLTAIVPDPSAFKGFQESYPQLQSSSLMGSSPNGAGSLQDRSPSYIPSPHIVPQSQNSNGKPIIPGQNNLVLVSTGSHPLDDSDTGSESDIQIIPSSLHHQSYNNSTIRLPNEKKPLPKSRDASRNKKASPAAMTQSLRNLLIGDGSSSLFPDQPSARPLSVRSDSIRIDDEQYPILEHSAKGSRYASIQANDSLYEEFELLGDDQDPPVLLRAGGDESRHSCCCNRPCWPQHTEYTLPQDKIRHSSQILKLISYNPSQQIAEESLSPANPPKSKPDSDSDDPDDSNSLGSSPGHTSPDSSPTKATHNPMPILDEDESTDSEGNRVIHPLTGYSSDDEGILPANFPSSAITIVENKEPSHIPSHLQSVFNRIEDLEAGLGGQPLESFLKFSQELQSSLKSLPAKTKSQLTDFAYQVLNGKSTWPQRLGKWIIGPIIGAGFAFAMGPIYDGGLEYLYIHGGAFLQQLLTGKLSSVLVRYIQVSAVPDGISRNAHLWKKGIAYLSQEEKEVGRMCLAGGISFLTAFIPLAYLITAENIARTGLGLPNWDNVFGLVVVVFGIPVYLDAFASDFNTAWNAIPAMKEWLGNLFCRKSLHSPALFLEEDQREKFDSDLGKLKNFLFRAPQVVIDEIYDNIKQIKESLETSFCSKLDEDLASQEAFATVTYLLSLGDEVVKGVTKLKSLYDVSVDIFKYMCLVFGTPARALALQFIGYSVFSLFCPDLVAQILGGVYGLLAFLPQTFMEDLGIDNFSKRFIVDEDSHGHSSHSTYRGCTKLYCAFQGLVYVFPLAVLTLQAFQQWSGNGWWPLAAMVPFLIPEFAAQTYSFNGTFNQQVATAITNVHSTKTRKCFGKEPAFDWKRDWLIRFIEASRGDLKHWRPDLIQKLTESIEIFKQQDA